MSLLLLKDDRRANPTTVEKRDAEREDPFSGIRCPLCAWRPQASSRWSCICQGTPEPSFPACGTTWNTFATHGRCPGCGHQWIWTNCLHCHQPSLHEDWYADN